MTLIVHIMLLRLFQYTLNHDGVKPKNLLILVGPKFQIFMTKIEVVCSHLTVCLSQLAKFGGSKALQGRVLTASILVVEF